MWTHAWILWTVLLLGFSLQHPYVAATTTMAPQPDSHTTESGKTSTITATTPFLSTHASVISDSPTVRKQLPNSTTLTIQTTTNTPSSQGRIEETTQLKNQELHPTQQRISATPNTADSTSSSNTTPIPTTSATYTTQPTPIDSTDITTSVEPFANISMNPTNQTPTTASQSFSSVNSSLTLNTTTTTTAAAAAAAARTTTTTLITNATNSSEKSEQISTTPMTEKNETHTTDRSLQNTVPATQGTTTTQSLTSTSISTMPHVPIAKEEAPKIFEVHIGGRQNETIKNMTEYELLVNICKKLSVRMKHENGNCFLGLTRKNGTLKFTSVLVAVNISYVDMIYSDMIKKETPTNFKHSDDDEIPKTLIAILASCGALVLILFAFAVYCTYHRRSYRKNQQHLTEELQTVENGYHDNPTLEVMEVQPETQEKKLPLNGEFSDSWIVPFDNLIKDDLPDEEDTHL